VLLEVFCTMLMQTTRADSVALGDNTGGVLKKGEKLFLEQKVDPSLIGGFVIDIGALEYPTWHFALLGCHVAAIWSLPPLAMCIDVKCWPEAPVHQ
jgi:hypothetical protein